MINCLGKRKEKREYLGILTIIIIILCVSYVYSQVNDESHFSNSPEKRGYFDSDLREIKVDLVKGRLINRTVLMKNLGDSIINISVEMSPELKNVLIVYDNKFYLNPHEERPVNFGFLSNNSNNLYFGYLKLITKKMEKDLIIISNVKEKSALMNLLLAVDKHSKIINPGDELTFDMIFFNLSSDIKNLSIDYYLKDLNYNVIYQKNEVLDTQVLYSKGIKLPIDIKPGDYIIIANAKSGNQTAIAAESFRIEYSLFSVFLSRFTIILAVFFFLIIVYFFYQIIIIQEILKRNIDKKENDKRIIKTVLKPI